MKSFINHPDNQKYLTSIRGLIQEMIAPHADDPQAVRALEDAAIKIIYEETRDLTPLPFGEYKPSEIVTVFDRIPVVNEDLVIE